MGISEKNTALIATMLGAFLTPYMGSAINLALPAISQEFNLQAVTTSWIATAYLLTAAVCLVPLGRLADIIGRKRIFTWGTVLFTLSSLLCAVAPSTPLLITARILQGIGSPMIFGTGVAILTSVFPPGEKGKVLGLNTAAVYLGLTIGPVLGGILTQQLGWRSIFLSGAFFGTIAFLNVNFNLKGEWAEAHGEHFDMVGTLLYGANLIAIMYGLSKLPTRLGFACLLGGVVLLLIFLLYESKQTYPVLNLLLFRNNQVFTFSNIAALINYAATFAVGFLMSFYLQLIKGLKPQEAGMVLLIQPLIQALFSPLTGRLSDKVEPRWVASSGMALTAFGLAALIFITPITSLFHIYLILGILGFGFAFFSSPNTNAVMGAVPRPSYGVAAGILGTMRLLGQMLSLGIAMMIFAIYLGEHPISSAAVPVLLKIMRSSFGIFTVLCGLGIIASLMRGRRNAIS